MLKTLTLKKLEKNLKQHKKQKNQLHVDKVTMACKNRTTVWFDDMSL